VSLAEAVSRGLLGAGKLAFKVLPRDMRKGAEDRFFSAVFQLTRVTNDAYGWRPPAPGASEPQDGEGEEG
jgi:hypothetical protein